MFEESRHILLLDGQEDFVPLLDKFGKDLQVAAVGFARQRAQALFHAQIYLIFRSKRQIARGVHSSDYPRLKFITGRSGNIAVSCSSRNQLHQQRSSSRGAICKSRSIGGAAFFSSMVYPSYQRRNRGIMEA